MSATASPAPHTGEDPQLRKLRQLVQESENTGNLDLMASLLADDITVIVPGTSVIQGKAEAVAFLRSWFEGFTIQIVYAEGATLVAEELATDWATYEQHTTDKRTGQQAAETGRILWLYKKYNGQWLQHFVIWNTL